jgi:hypothetical protein
VHLLAGGLSTLPSDEVDPRAIIGLTIYWQPDDRIPEMSTAHTRAHLHELVEGLPESEVVTAERFLEYLSLARDPLLRALAAAPLDDEPESDEDSKAIEEGRTALARGDTIPDQELRRQLNI